MNNFVTGLVQRGAGLPLPISMRPSVGPQQVPPSLSFSAKAPPVSDVAPIRQSAGGSSLADEIPETDSPARKQSILQPLAQTLPGSPSAIERADRPPSKLAETSSLLLRPEPSAVHKSETSGTAADNVRTTPPRIDGGAMLPPAEHVGKTQVLPAYGEREVAAASRSVQGSSPPSRLEPRVLESPTAAPATTLNAPSMRPVPRQERLAQGGLPQPAPSAPQAAGRGKAPRSHSIQVKIGRVEIRSTQPTPAARPTRPPGSSGFDDFKLARTYLDRNLR